MAFILGVSVDGYVSWENGRRKACSVKHIRKIDMVLSGLFDGTECMLSRLEYNKDSMEFLDLLFAQLEILSKKNIDDARLHVAQVRKTIYRNMLG